MVAVWYLQHLHGLVRWLREAQTYLRVPPPRLLWFLLHFSMIESIPDRWSACIHRFGNMAPLWALLSFLSGSEG